MENSGKNISGLFEPVYRRSNNSSNVLFLLWSDREI